jgi:hypothetical protein
LVSWPWSSFEVGAVGEPLDVEPLDVELSDDELWAPAGPGPKKAAPIPAPVSSEPATTAAAMGFFIPAT